MVRILDFRCHGPGSIPGQGAEIEIPQAKQHGKKIKKIISHWRFIEHVQGMQNFFSER